MTVTITKNLPYNDYEKLPGLRASDMKTLLKSPRAYYNAKTLGIKQEGVSRIEKRSDLVLSTLRSYVEAMGGELRLIAEFPDRPPIALSGVAELNAAQVVPAKARKALRQGQASCPARG